MSDASIDYPRLVQTALLGVVRQALAVTAEAGLPGEHHFYITFRTDAPGVRLPDRLRKRHPSEMVVVLQHQFYELAVDDESFAVSLKFGGALERIEVPFSAVITFTDPSVPFSLQLGRAEPEKEGEAAESDEPAPAAPEGRAEVLQFPRDSDS